MLIWDAAKNASRSVPDFETNMAPKSQFLGIPGETTGVQGSVVKSNGKGGYTYGTATDPWTTGAAFS